MRFELNQIDGRGSSTAGHVHVVVTDNKCRVYVLDGPRRRVAAGGHLIVDLKDRNLPIALAQSPHLLCISSPAICIEVDPLRRRGVKPRPTARYKAVGRLYSPAAPRQTKAAGAAHLNSAHDQARKDRGTPENDCRSRLHCRRGRDGAPPCGQASSGTSDRNDCAAIRSASDHGFAQVARSAHNTRPTLRSRQYSANGSLYFRW